MLAQANKSFSAKKVLNYSIINQRLKLLPKLQSLEDLYLRQA